MKRRALLRHFGSLKRIREATVNDIAQVKGMNRDLAAKIRAHLDEMASLLDREESADATEVDEQPRELPAPIEESPANLQDIEQGIKVDRE